MTSPVVHMSEHTDRLRELHARRCKLAWIDYEFDRIARELFGSTLASLEIDVIEDAEKMDAASARTYGLSQGFDLSDGPGMVPDWQAFLVLIQAQRLGAFREPCDRFEEGMLRDAQRFQGAAERGRIKRVAHDKGFAFIARDSGQDDVFLRLSDVQGAMQCHVGDHICFRVRDTGKGPQAVEPRLVTSTEAWTIRYGSRREARVRQCEEELAIMEQGGQSSSPRGMPPALSRTTMP